MESIVPTLIEVSTNDAEMETAALAEKEISAGLLFGWFLARAFSGILRENVVTMLYFGV